MHMSIGSPMCCGVIEIFPEGGYAPIRGHGNMARRMGIEYRRMDVPSDSDEDSTNVDILALQRILEDLLSLLIVAPSCLHPDALDDPYFINKS